MVSNKTRKIKEINSNSVFRYMRVGFKLLGFDPSTKFRPLYYLFSIILNFTVTFYYPFSMFINMFFLKTKESFVSNLALTLCINLCSVKIINSFIKMPEIDKLSDCLATLDGSIRNQDEKDYMRYILKLARRFFLFYAVFYSMVAAVLDLPVIFAEERRLIYLAWFPWDWKNSTALYHSTHAYQLIGIYIQLYQNAIDDTFPGIFLWLLKGHLHTLSLRVMKIGHDEKKTASENFNELVTCIEEHKICLTYYHLCQSLISSFMIIQFIATECILCATAIYILFFAKNAFDIVFLIFYFGSMVLEFSLCCYCGSELVDESEHFITGLYSCNWMDQDLRFRKVLIIFMQQQHNPWLIRAGGIVDVSLITWLTILKTAYSLFAVFSQVA